jgi:hypothetical protein
MTDDLTRRLEAVERAVTDGHTDLASLHDAADAEARLDELERRLDEVNARLADLDATTQALRGYLGGVDGVADDVERRADLALAKAEAVEDAVFEGSDGLAVERIPPEEPEPGRPDSDRAMGAEHGPDRSGRHAGSETTHCRESEPPTIGGVLSGRTDRSPERDASTTRAAGAIEDGKGSFVGRLRALL